MNANMKPPAHLRRNAAAAVLSLVVVLMAPAAEKELPRLRISKNQRYLVTTDGKPFFWLADTAWWIRQLPPPLVKHYLSTRAQQGFNVIQDDAIDLAYYGTPLEDVWRKHGYIGVFFASYIHSPEDMAIHFIGRSRPGRGDSTPRWIKHLLRRHGAAANHRPAGSAWDPSFDDGFNITVASGFSDFEYLYPFYFGRSGENVLVLMFEKPRDGGEMRFAQSPSGGGTGNPAWDFVYFRRDYAVG